MRTEYIKKGDVISILCGELEILGVNRGNLVNVIRREFDGDGNITLEEEEYLTESEIADLMKDNDGKNHRVYFE